MALSNDAVFPQEIVSGVATTTAAIGTITGLAPTNTVLLFTADATDGSIITNMSAIPRATAAANVLVLFSSKDGGTNKYVILMKTAAAQTISTTALATAIDFGYTLAAPLYLAPGESLYVGNTVADPASGYAWQCRGRDM